MLNFQFTFVSSWQKAATPPGCGQSSPVVSLSGTKPGLTWLPDIPGLQENYRDGAWLDKTRLATSPPLSTTPPPTCNIIHTQRSQPLHSWRRNFITCLVFRPQPEITKKCQIWTISCKYTNIPIYSLLSSENHFPSLFNSQNQTYRY